MLLSKCVWYDLPLPRDEPRAESREPQSSGAARNCAAMHWLEWAWLVKTEDGTERPKCDWHGPPSKSAEPS